MPRYEPRLSKPCRKGFGNPEGIQALSPGLADAIGLPWVNIQDNIHNPESG